MEGIEVFIDKEEINKLFEDEKYKNCMEKKYFEYIVSTGKIEYIDKYLKYSKNKNLIESMVFTNKVVKVIDKLSVKLEDQRYVGELENSGIYNIEVSEEIVKKYHDQILTNGVFCLITIEENIDKRYRYYIQDIEVLEDINVDLNEYKNYFSERVKKYRETKTKEMPATYVPDDYISEMDLVLNTIGISTKELTFWEKILFLVRLIPLCEANYNLMELGGNGIGKTKTYSMFSPECEIVQEMLVTEIIYNRQSKEKGLLATKDVIVFDEVNKIKLDGDKEKIIPQLLNFMADGQTTSPRKVISKTSLVFSGNIMGIEERIEKNEKNIFDNPHKFEDNAFLDRIHFFLPAWGLRRYSRNIHGLNIQKRVFRFDYFSKALSLLREKDYSFILDKRGYILVNGSEREVRAIRKTVSGLIKLTHPDEQIDDFTLEAYIAIAIKGRGLINKFLHNKNKNNVNVINVELLRKIPETIETGKVSIIPVNELLKRMIYKDQFDEVNRYFKEKIQYQNQFFNFYNSYSCDEYIKKFEFSPYKNLNLQGQKLYEGKYYPNRHIVPISNVNGTHVILIKVALDKIGIEKNKREYKKIKNELNQLNAEFRGFGERVLIVEAKNQFILQNSILINGEQEISYLNNQFDLNYDGLFGEKSLDENNFKGLSIGSYSFDLDISNSFEIERTKKIWCEELKQEIVPKYMYNSYTGNYYYVYKVPPLNTELYTSKFMNYVEFKYFLRDNDIIKF